MTNAELAFILIALAKLIIAAATFLHRPRK